VSKELLRAEPAPGLRREVRTIRGLSEIAEGHRDGKLSWNVPKRGCGVYSHSGPGLQNGNSGLESLILSWARRQALSKC
jgi:hypothetical protein